jgi:uncharacterized protein affecting Mg2+/Co2+ transport
MTGTFLKNAMFPLLFTNIRFFRGTFKMERENGTFFDASIPCFVLEGKRDLPNP